MIAVTDKAAKRLRSMIEASRFSKETAGIRFAVKAGGCSGFIYNPLIVAEGPGSHDLIFESSATHGIKIFVDKKSLSVVNGTEIDLSDNLIEGFIFNNPNAKNSCGCGTSFELKHRL